MKRKTGTQKQGFTRTKRHETVTLQNDVAVLHRRAQAALDNGHRIAAISYLQTAITLIEKDLLPLSQTVNAQLRAANESKDVEALSPDAGSQPQTGDAVAKGSERTVNGSTRDS